jgi:hypothetical protein
MISSSDGVGLISIFLIISFYSVTLFLDLSIGSGIASTLHRADGQSVGMSPPDFKFATDG